MDLTVFGKLPSRGDFLRVNLVHPLSRKVDRWLEQGNGMLVANSFPFPASVRVLWWEDQDLLLGAFVPSSDAVGRRFPLGAARICSGEAAPAPVVVVAADAFLSACVDKLQAAERVPESELLAELQGLATVPLNIAGARALCRDAAEREVIEDIEGRLFTADEEAYYAFRTLLLAIDLAVQGQAVVIECPLRVDVDQFFWLHCITTLGQAHPVVVWVEEPEPRMLVAFGPPPDDLLCVLGGKSEPAWYWPLTTKRDGARTQAAEHMRAGLRRQREETIEGFSKRLLSAFQAGVHRA